MLLWITLAVTVATLAVPFLGPLSSMFGFVPLSTPQMGVVVVVVVGYIAATEAAKAWFYRAQNNANATDDPMRVAMLRERSGVK